MHGWNRLALAFSFLFLGACSSGSLLKPDCHSCTVEEQGWKDLSWQALGGRWKGYVENVRNERGATRKKSEKPVELVFVDASAFLQARGASCAGVPPGGMVLNGVLWEQASRAKEYEHFSPAEDGRVAYGRLSFSEGSCRYRRLGRVMGRNRLALPTVSFSERSVPSVAAGKKGGRSLASIAGQQEVSVEFLRFASEERGQKSFAADGKRPADARESERPALILRVFKVGTTEASPGAERRGEWSGTDESIYRLWRTE